VATTGGVLQWYTETASPATVETANEWLASAHAAVQANSVGGYVNYVEPDMPASRYFAANLERLAAIRQKYDPGGLMYSGM
jgi:FAD/FMN-containing dehydrogenase